MPSPWNWWLRTPNSGNSNNARNVNTDGTLNNNNAFNGNMGVAPDLVKPSQSKQGLKSVDTIKGGRTPASKR